MVRVQESRSNPQQKTRIEHDKILFRKADIRAATVFRLQTHPGDGAAANFKGEKSQKMTVPESNLIIISYDGKVVGNFP